MANYILTSAWGKPVIPSRVWAIDTGEDLTEFFNNEQCFFGDTIMNPNTDEKFSLNFNGWMDQSGQVYTEEDLIEAWDSQPEET